MAGRAASEQRAFCQTPSLFACALPAVSWVVACACAAASLAAALALAVTSLALSPAADACAAALAAACKGQSGTVFSHHVMRGQGQG